MVKQHARSYNEFFLAWWLWNQVYNSS